MVFFGGDSGTATVEDYRIARQEHADYRAAIAEQAAADRLAMEQWYSAGRAQQAAQQATPDSSANVPEYRADVESQASWADALSQANALFQKQQRSRLMEQFAGGGRLLDPTYFPLIGPPMTGPVEPPPPGQPSESSANVAEYRTGRENPRLPVDLSRSLPEAPGLLGVPPDQRTVDNGNEPGTGSANAAEHRIPWSPASDPEVQLYLKDLGAWYQRHKGGAVTDPGIDGNFGTAAAQAQQPASNAGFPSLSSVAFPGFLHHGKGGKWTYERAGVVLQSMSAGAMKDPSFAGELMYVMSATGAYPQAAADAVIDRLYRDPKTGQLAGHWTETDLTALHTALIQASLIQADEVPQGTVRDPLEILRDRTHQANEMVTTDMPLGPEKTGKGRGGGRGGSRHSGSGGSGGSAAMRVDPDQLKLVVNNVAKQELGRALTDGEAQRFVNAFMTSAGEMSKLNPTGEATSFIQGNQALTNEAAGQSAGQFVMALARFLASANPSLPKATQANG